MSCSNCGSGGGTPRGCKNNGNCSSGGCNKLEVYDWLANVSLPSGQAPYDIVEVRFKNSRKSFFRNTGNLSLFVGDVVVVDTSPGFDIGVVSVVGELARIQVRKKAPGFKPVEAKRILRIANQEDIDKWKKSRELEKDVMFASRTLALNLNLEMKISDVEYQGDLTKATFYYTAEGRVDFRQLIKDMADAFKIRVEMRQVGSRQEASRLGGIGSCGRELCCSTWLTDFRSVSTSAARYQQLSLNPQKLAGQCGKLKCCLNYELDMYLEALKTFPKTDVKLLMEGGTATHIKTDVFKREMWYSLYGEGVSGLVALSPERVLEVIQMNKDGKKPKELKEYVEVVKTTPEYSNVVGQDSLNRFEHTFTKKKKKKNKPIPNQQNRNTGNEVKQGQPKNLAPQAAPAIKVNLDETQNPDVIRKKKRPKKRRKPGNNNLTRENNSGPENA